MPFCGGGSGGAGRILRVGGVLALENRGSEKEESGFPGGAAAGPCMRKETYSESGFSAEIDFITSLRVGAEFAELFRVSAFEILKNFVRANVKCNF